MSATTYTLTKGWSTTNRYLAAAQIDVLLINPVVKGGMNIVWTTTTSAGVPTLLPEHAANIKPEESQSMTLASGEYLWIAFEGDMLSTIATLET